MADDETTKVDPVAPATETPDTTNMPATETPAEEAPKVEETPAA